MKVNTQMFGNLRKLILHKHGEREINVGLMNLGPKKKQIEIS